MIKYKYLKNNTLRFDIDKCIGCGTCIEVCPHGVFEKNGRKVEAAHTEYCMECGACRKNCPVEAINVDAGVGCAAAVISGVLSGTAPSCGCSADGSESSSGCC